MFWDLDYAGMDFSENLPFRTTWLSANEIYKSDNTSQLKELNQRDKIYAHITDKEQLNMEFTVQAADGPRSINTYFLAGTGYYHENSHYIGKPQLNELVTFSGKGAFDKFSRKNFEELLYILKNSSNKDITSNK
jgi:hypothetical protein